MTQLNSNEGDAAVDQQAVGSEDPQSGLQAELLNEPYPVVGDFRRLKVYSCGPNFNNNDEVGAAWQGEDGRLSGTGLCKSMLFEPVVGDMYINASIGNDVSPLSVLGFRLSQSPFLRIEWEDAD